MCHQKNYTKPMSNQELIKYPISTSSHSNPKLGVSSVLAILVCSLHPLALRLVSVHVIFAFSHPFCMGKAFPRIA